MQPKQFEKLGEKKDVLLNYRKLVEEFRATQQKWTEEYSGIPIRDREARTEEKWDRAKELLRALFELPEGTPEAGEVEDLPPEESVLVEGENGVHQARELQTAYGKVRVTKYQSEDQSPGSQPEYNAFFMEPSPGITVAQVLKYGGVDGDLIDKEGSLNTNYWYHSIMPEGLESYSDVSDALETIETIASSFGIEQSR